MQYHNVHKAVFLHRPNRFIAQVLLEGKEERVHVKNTGRCKELLMPGTEVYLEQARGPGRKTAWSLVTVQKGDLLVNIDSQAPNKVVEEALRSGRLRLREELEVQVRREVKLGDSRLDFLVESSVGKTYIEVKGVTLEENGAVFFPDAPTLRGIKHLQELERAVQAGHKACALFVVQLERAAYFSPNDRTHPAFGEALRHAQRGGVEVRAYTCKVAQDSITLGEGVPLRL